MGKLEAGSVALVTGAGRGQGRCHAVALAAAGADVALVDIGEDIASVPYPMASGEELAETEAAVKEAGAEAISIVADVRSRAAMEGAVATTVERFGRLDVLVANAGIASWHAYVEMTEEVWRDMIDVDLTGAANTVYAALPDMVSRGHGRIICTGSTLGRQGMANMAHYSAAKWGLHGFVKSVAMEVAEQGITVNLINPTVVDTPMMRCDAVLRLFCPDIENPTLEDALPRYATLNKIPIDWMDPAEVSKTVVFLASEDARYITGAAVDVAAGANTMYTA